VFLKFSQKRRLSEKVFRICFNIMPSSVSLWVRTFDYRSSRRRVGRIWGKQGYRTGRYGQEL
ncbi:MAG: hypothetical protein Q7U96_05075, partial [Chloroflexota bacterium]|nr:hypothetical protein [Chloroflexota bacterium]